MARVRKDLSHVETVYVSAAELAKHFGVSENTIWNLVRDGKLKPVRLRAANRFHLKNAETALSA